MFQFYVFAIGFCFIWSSTELGFYRSSLHEGAIIFLPGGDGICLWETGPENNGHRQSQTDALLQVKNDSSIKQKGMSQLEET